MSLQFGGIKISNQNLQGCLADSPFDDVGMQEPFAAIGVDRNVPGADLLLGRCAAYSETGLSLSGRRDAKQRQ